MEELSCAAQLWLTDNCYCHHTTEGMGKGKNLTGIACWGDRDEPDHPHLLGHLPALKPGCLEPPGSARSPCHALAPRAWAQTVTCCPQCLLLAIKPIPGHIFSWGITMKKAFTSSMDTALSLLCLPAHTNPLRRCLSLLISVQCFNCMYWKLLLQYLVGELHKALIIC